MTDPGSMALQSFGDGLVWMDSRRRTTLSGVVVASMVERPGTVDAIVKL